MKPYSVLLLYPDYMAETFGHETYFAHVEAETPREALTTARLQAMNCEGNDACEDGEDFWPLLVLDGHQQGHNIE